MRIITLSISRKLLSPKFANLTMIYFVRAIGYSCFCWAMSYLSPLSTHWVESFASRWHGSLCRMGHSKRQKGYFETAMPIKTTLNIYFWPQILGSTLESVPKRIELKYQRILKYNSTVGTGVLCHLKIISVSERRYSRFSTLNLFPTLKPFLSFCDFPFRVSDEVTFSPMSRCIVSL